MHDLHLIHTDLKPENILLVSSEYIKVPDYKVMLQRFGCMLFSFFILHFPQDFKYVSASLRVEMTWNLECNQSFSYPKKKKRTCLLPFFLGCLFLHLLKFLRYTKILIWLLIYSNIVVRIFGAMSCIVEIGLLLRNIIC